jgi:hypothetical protein
LIDLELRRTRHTAVVLDSGETLLVGGARPSGAGSSVAVTPFEVVSPVTRRSRVDGLAALADGRIEPSAVRLEGGNVLVGGGYDANGAPVETLEWFTPDGSSQATPGGERCGFPFEACAAVAPRHHRVLIALPGGGALTAGGCAPAATQDSRCLVCGEGRGCPAPAPSADWISPRGEVTPVELEQPPECPAPFSPEFVLLAAGSDGAPWLLASDEDVEPPCRAAFRFEPWSRPPVFGVANLRIERWPDPRTGVTSLGADVFVWLSQDDPPFLVGTRAGTRGALSQNETLLSSDPNAPLVPLHLAPDWLPEHRDRPKAIYTPLNEGRLILERERDGYPPVTVSVTDTRYDDVTITIGFAGDGPPLLMLGAQVIGGPECQYPEGPITPLVVTRVSATVSIADGAGRSTTCNVPAGPVSVAFRAGATSTTLTSLGMQRH